MVRAQTIQIYLPSGNPAGIRVASLTTRTVRVFEVPRSLLREFLKRPEATRVGVYYLFGPDGDETAQAYIGQTGNVGERLTEHKSKDFWTKAMVAVSLTNEWTSTHVAYLEWLSIDRATRAGRYALSNGNRASNPFTPEPLEADCREFLDTIAVLLATLGAPILEPVQPPISIPASGGDPGDPPQELLFFREAGCDATGYQTSEGLLMKSGSTGRPDFRPSVTPSTRSQREALRQQGVIEVKSGRLVFVKDHLFPSPSAAGCALVGGSNNGRTSWKNAAGQDLNHIEEAQLNATIKSEGLSTTDVESVVF